MCTWYSQGLGAGGEQPALVLPGLFSEAWLFSEPGGKGRIAFVAEVSPAETQERGRAAAGAVAAVPSHREQWRRWLCCCSSTDPLTTNPRLVTTGSAASAVVARIKAAAALRLESGLWQEASRAHQPPAERQ